jgi:putative sigma-54 modulation protein
MIIEVRFQGVELSDELRDLAVRRVHTHIGPHEREVKYVTVRLSDVNGPKGGVDKECRVTIGGPRIGVRVLSERSVDLRAAIDLATSRMGQVLAGDSDKGRARRRSSSTFARIAG